MDGGRRRNYNRTTNLRKLTTRSHRLASTARGTGTTTTTATPTTTRRLHNGIGSLAPPRTPQTITTFSAWVGIVNSHGRLDTIAPSGDGEGLDTLDCHAGAADVCGEMDGRAARLLIPLCSRRAVVRVAAVVVVVG